MLRSGKVEKSLKSNTKVSVQKIKQAPIRVMGASKRDMRTQFGALCFRLHEGKVQILLITSRGTGRWIIPKGWPMDGETPCGAAATEAWEEAGAKGRIYETVIGFYSYSKVLKDDDLPCVVAVFPLRVSKLVRDFPETGQRKRAWFSQKKATSMVDEPELARLIKHFDPRKLRH